MLDDDFEFQSLFARVETAFQVRDPGALQCVRTLLSGYESEAKRLEKAVKVGSAALAAGKESEFVGDEADIDTWRWLAKGPMIEAWQSRILLLEDRIADLERLAAHWAPSMATKSKRNKANQDIGPTPEQAMMIAEHNTLWTLRREGFLGWRHLEAAEEINEVWYAITRPVFTKTTTIFRGGGGGRPGEMSDFIADALHHRWRPWQEKVAKTWFWICTDPACNTVHPEKPEGRNCAACGGQKTVRRHKGRVPLVIDIVVNDRPLSVAAKDHRVREDQAIRLLRAALEVYRSMMPREALNRLHRIV